MQRNTSRLILLFLTCLFLASCQQWKLRRAQDDTKVVVMDPVEVVAWKHGRYNASATRVNDLIHTRLDVRFDWQNQYLHGEALLKLKPYFYPTDSLTLDAKGFDLKQVSLVKNNQYVPLEYDYSDTMLIRISLDKKYTRDEEYEVFIRYTAKPNELPEGGSVAITSDKGLYFINPYGEESAKPKQIWTQGETEASSCWFPTIDKPNERTSQELYVTVDNKYETLSNGRLESSVRNADGTRTDYWVQDIPHAPYLFMMAVGEFSVVKDSWRGLDVDYYVEPEYEKYARKIFGNTPEMIEFYSNLLGVQYPWDKYSQVVVRDFVSGAMENTSAVIHFEGLQQTSREMLDGDYEDIIAHELIHHWFGDLVTCESWANIPLNEAFATYGEVLWEDYKYGPDAGGLKLRQDLESYLDEAEVKQVDLIRFDYDHRDDMFDSHSYSKGSRVLHMLRNMIGDEAFFHSLNLYLTRYAHRPVEIHEVRLSFEEVTGQDLNWFFNQWFFDKGHPILEVEPIMEEGGVNLKLRQTHSADGDLVYHIPLKVDFYYGDEVERKSIVFDEEEEEFFFETNRQPDLVNVDAQKMLLCEKINYQPTSAFIHQYNYAPLYLDRYEAVEHCAIEQEDNSAAYKVVVDALDDPFWDLRRLAVSEIDLDLDYYGVVKEKLLDMAENDEHALVRAEALDKLRDEEDEQYRAAFEKGMTDSSYTVIGTALKGLADIDPQAAMGKASMLESEENHEIKGAIASTYANHGDEQYQTFFESKLDNEGGISLYYMLYYYGNFLSRMDKPVVMKGIRSLKEHSLDTDPFWVAYGGRGALTRIVDAYEVRKEMAQNALSTADKRDLGLISNLELELEEAGEIIATAQAAINAIDSDLAADQY